jgi:hypothetical protein
MASTSAQADIDTRPSEPAESTLSPPAASNGKGKRKADEDGEGGDEGTAKVKKSRNRKPVTCARSYFSSLPSSAPVSAFRRRFETMLTLFPVVFARFSLQNVDAGEDLASSVARASTDPSEPSTAS